MQTSHIGTSDVIFAYNGRDGVITDNNGLIYMRARYYSPIMRRFINADIIHGTISDSTSLNRYSYVNGNPVSFVDPFGLERKDTTPDAIWLQYEDGASGFGHTGLLIQDTDGVWYLFNWAAKDAGLGTLIGVNSEVVDYDQMWVKKEVYVFDTSSTESLVNDINKFLGTDDNTPKAKIVTGAIYFEGDFANTFEAIDSLVLDVIVQTSSYCYDDITDLKEVGPEWYNLYDNNCLQKTMEMLSFGTFDEHDELIKSKMHELSVIKAVEVYFHVSYSIFTGYKENLRFSYNKLGTPNGAFDNLSQFYENLQ